MSLGLFAAGLIFWFNFYFAFTARAWWRNPDVLINYCDLFLLKGLLKKESRLHYLYFDKCCCKTPHLKVGSYTLLFGHICNLLLLVLSIIHLINKIPSLNILDNVLNYIMISILVIEATTFIASYSYLVSRSHNYFIEMEGMTKEEKNKINALIKKEYPNYYKNIEEGFIKKKDKSSIVRFINKCVIDSKQEELRTELRKNKDKIIYYFAHDTYDIVDKSRILLTSSKTEDVIAFFEPNQKAVCYCLNKDTKKCDSSEIYSIFKKEHGPIIAISNTYALIKDEESILYLINVI